jgi:hypothetical protein
MFTQALSKEVGSRGITVNNVQPGPIDTNLNPASGDWAVPQKAATALDRYGHVDEIAAMVAFVAVPESSYITHEGGAFQANDETLPVTEYAIRKLSTYNLSHLLLMGNTRDFPVLHSRNWPMMACSGISVLSTEAHSSRM